MFTSYKRKTGLPFYTVATVVTLVVGTVYEFLQPPSLLPIHVLAGFMIPLVLGVVPNHRKMTGKTFLESEDAQAAYKMGVPPSSSVASPQRSLRHLRNQLRSPNPLLTRVGALLLIAALGLEMYYKKGSC